MLTLLHFARCWNAGAPGPLKRQRCDVGRSPCVGHEATPVAVASINHSSELCCAGQLLNVGWRAARNDSRVMNCIIKLNRWIVTEWRNECHTRRDETLQNARPTANNARLSSAFCRATHDFLTLVNRPSSRATCRPVSQPRCLIYDQLHWHRCHHGLARTQIMQNNSKTRFGSNCIDMASILCQNVLWTPNSQSLQSSHSASVRICNLFDEAIRLKVKLNLSTVACRRKVRTQQIWG